MLNNTIKPFFVGIIFLIAGVLIDVNVYAQKSDSLDYVQPFSKGTAFRSWSVGLNGGVTSPFNEDFTKASFQPAYGGFIKKQILSTWFPGKFFSRKCRR
jgi:OOP family OmpA-OmpF porin